MLCFPDQYTECVLPTLNYLIFTIYFFFYISKVSLVLGLIKQGGGVSLRHGGAL